MFCANTRPVSDASTDFGEMCPLIVLRSDRPRGSDGRPGGPRLNGDTPAVRRCWCRVVTVAGARPPEPASTITLAITTAITTTVTSAPARRRRIAVREGRRGARREPPGRLGGPALLTGFPSPLARRERYRPYRRDG